MRTDVKKILFMGLSSEKEAFFREAQKMGIIHFQEKKNACVADVQLFLEALRTIREFPFLEQEEGNPHQIAKEIIELKHRLEEEERCILLEIDRVAIFGDFASHDIADLKKKGLHVQFFKGEPKQEFMHIAEDYYVAINSVPITGKEEIKIPRSVNELKECLQEMEAEKEKMRQMARFNHLLHQALANSLNHVDLKNAENGANGALEGTLFTAIGWVPEHRKEHALALNYAVEIAIEPTDNVPTYLENTGLAKMGEDLIHIYDTPSPQDKDPSLEVLLSFLLFFAIIIGDGGYGSIYLGIALYIRYKFPLLTAAKKRLLNLTTLLCSGCVIWGILSSSFFGLTLAPDNPLRSFSLVTYLAKQKLTYHQLSPDLLDSFCNQVLLELSLFIGVLHLIFGLGRYARRNWSHLGWMIALIGGYLYFPVFLGVSSILNYYFAIPYLAGGVLGLNMVFIGIALAVFLAILRNGLLGLAELMNVIQIFADVLSYIRLYALGLSGAILSATINQLASHLPVPVAILVLILGHSINMVLGIMGGVIHGLRLNFLEWYHYSFEGGGRPFKPLESKEKI